MKRFLLSVFLYRKKLAELPVQVGISPGTNVDGKVPLTVTPHTGGRQDTARGVGFEDMANVLVQPGSDVATKLSVFCGCTKTVVSFPLRGMGEEGGWG